ncbi:MBL fold metallo-hydrolase [Streptomyces sp. NPDC059092]|uniref:MBL fold metallo-hydrolase n=1 Tax=Streptomyces sp. NPDC059092 TaxID=3346725 RepID=UPI00369BF3A3
MSDAAAALPGRPRGGVLSGPATARAVNVLAPNPSPMTLDGTNTWIVSEPGSDLAVVIDPGPLDDVHLKAVISTAAKAGKRIALTLLTHGHPDHADGAARFAALTRTEVRALDPALRLGDEGLAAGDVITTGGMEMRVVPTPGHTSDSLCFHLPADRAVLTGDTVLGRGTTLVAHPDGRLGDYLDSLRRLRSLTVDDGVDTVLPGHGPVLDDAQGAVEFYLAHRANRLAQIETAVENGHRTPAEVVAHVYAGVDRSLWPAAELSVRAQLDYLREHGLIPEQPGIPD